jgi:hypothetical protein
MEWSGVGGCCYERAAAAGVPCPVAVTPQRKHVAVGRRLVGRRRRRRRHCRRHDCRLLLRDAIWSDEGDDGI